MQNFDADRIRMPRQDVAEGQKHGYIGEDTGEVEVIDRPEPGDSNAVPDVETAQKRVAAAQRALETAERDLETAQKRNKEKDAETKAETKAAAKSPDKARAASENK